MIVVTIGENVHGGSYVFCCNGHARKDVCCASTTLAYTLAQCLMDMHARGKLKKKPSIKLKAGDTKIVAKPKDEYLAEVLHTFLVIQAGLKVLAHNYPEDIGMSISEQSEKIEESST